VSLRYCDCLYEPLEYVTCDMPPTGSVLAFVLSTRRNNNEVTTNDAERLVTVAAAAATALIAKTWPWRLDVNKKK